MGASQQPAQGVAPTSPSSGGDHVVVREAQAAAESAPVVLYEPDPVFADADIPAGQGLPRAQSVRDDLGQVVSSAPEGERKSCDETPLEAIGASVALAFVTLLGIAVGIIRALQEHASRRVGTDLGSTRLQPR